MRDRLVSLLWTALSVTGAIYATANWREALSDYAAVQRLPDYDPHRPRERVARAAIRREQLRCLAHVLFLVPGVMAIIDPPPKPLPHRGRALSLLCLIVGQSAIVLNDILDQRDREKITKALKHDIVRAMEENTAAILADTAANRDATVENTEATIENTEATKLLASTPAREEE